MFLFKSYFSAGRKWDSLYTNATLQMLPPNAMLLVFMTLSLLWTLVHPYPKLEMAAIHYSFDSLSLLCVSVSDRKSCKISFKGGDPLCDATETLIKIYQIGSLLSIIEMYLKVASHVNGIAIERLHCLKV